VTEYTDTRAGAHDNGMTRMEQRILLLTCPCHFFTHMFILVFPAVTMPVVKALGMPLEDVVKLGFLMYLMYGIGALPAGYIADRWQARRLLIYGVYAMGAGLLLTGLFPNPGSIRFGLFLVGIGASIYHPAGLALISRTVRQRGYALGINGIFGNLGIAAAPLVTGVLTWLFSWDRAFVILGAAAILTGLLLSLIRVDESPSRVEKPKGAGDGDYVKYFVILCVALVMGGLTYRGNTVLLPAYLELKTTFFDSFISSFSFFKTQGTATLAATILTSLVFLVGVVGQLLGGRAADRYDLRWAYLIVHASSVPFLVAMAFTTNVPLALCAAAFVLFSLGMQPIENSLLASLTPTRWRSVAFAAKFVLVFGVGASAVYLVGMVKKLHSLEGVYVFLAGVAMLLVSSIIVLIIASRKVGSIRN
jgi:MFS family permease